MSSPSGSTFQTFPEYQPDPSIRDDAIRDGHLNDCWQEFFDSCREHGKGILEEWRRETFRLSRERGLAYHADVSGSGWFLDPVPWIISIDAWSELEKGISQRSLLYDAILRDLYGEQKILRTGLLPPALVFSSPGFVRSLKGSLLQASTPGIGMAGFDLARIRDGSWTVLNDRFDGTFGLGLALENRTVVNQVLPDLFRRCQVRRIGHFFKDWFNYLADTTDARATHPRVVILDSNLEGSPESNFLSNYCGIPRAAAQDLTVRSGSLWLKALSGLEPVHSIWNRDIGVGFDPLGVPRGTPGGPPGAFEAMRLGSVAVASHPGVAVLESPGIYPFTDRLCRELLGEDLLVKNVKTWWGGEPGSLLYILENLHQLVIKSVTHSPIFKTYYGRLCSTDELAGLRDLIRSCPGKYVGQEELEISTVPTTGSDGLIPHRAVLRGFAFIDHHKNARVMPGGLARVGRADGSIVSTRSGGASKDIWVRGEIPDAPIRIAEEVEQSRIHVKDVVTSRSAENLFWAGRYAERTDFVARFAFRLIISSVLGFSFGRKLEKDHETLLFNGLFEFLDLKAWLKARPPFDQSIGLLLNDRSCPASVSFNLSNFNQACLGAREKWSPLSLHAIQKIVDDWNEGTNLVTSPYQFRPHLERLELNLAAFVGLNLDSMTRDAGWALLDAGRAIERSLTLAGLLDFLFSSAMTLPTETLLCESVLVITDSLRTYQSRFYSAPSRNLSLQLLLGVGDYPRSISFLVKRMSQNLAKLPGEDSRVRILEKLASLDKFIGEFVSKNQFSSAPAVLSEISEELQNLSDDLTKSYFSHASE